MASLLLYHTWKICRIGYALLPLFGDIAGIWDVDGADGGVETGKDVVFTKGLEVEKGRVESSNIRSEVGLRGLKVSIKRVNCF